MLSFDMSRYGPFSGVEGPTHNTYVLDWYVLLLHEKFSVKWPRRSIGLSDLYEKIFVVIGVKVGAFFMVLHVV